MKSYYRIIPLCLIFSFILAASAWAADKRIMVFGDSNSFGWETDADGLVGRMPVELAWPGVMAGLLGEEYTLIVEALGGRTTNIDLPPESGSGFIPGAGMNGAAYLPAALSSHMPLDLVIIMLGTNDYRHDCHRSAQDVAEGIMRLVGTVQAGEWQRKTGFAVPRVLVVSPPKLNVTDERFKSLFAGSLAKSEALAGLLRPKAEAAEADFLDAAGVVPFAQGDDDIHLTPENHAVLGAAVADSVKRIFADSPAS